MGSKEASAMPNDDVRRKLLAEYAATLVAERATWERLREPQLSEAERCHAFGQWKRTAARLKTLTQQLRDEPRSLLPSQQEARHSAQPAYERLPKAAGKRETVVSTAAAVWARVNPLWGELPVKVRWLFGG
jgi:hypothetical protein